ncbi:hypothetical protein ACGFMO_37005 [Streptomyces niveus]|uniref:hypothetical protein n=1 Tax=Streptomyces niveus TaxID=193462 RepID=UPI003716330B
MPDSPLIGADDLVAYGPDVTTEPGAPHAVAELDALIGLLTTPRSRIHSVAVGHSRDEASRAFAAAFADAWTARGGAVLAVVDWPESAAPWLRHSTAWDPARTVAFASLLDSRVPALAGPDTVHGLRGVTADGAPGTYAGAGSPSVHRPDLGERGGDGESRGRHTARCPSRPPGAWRIQK